MKVAIGSTNPVKVKAVKDAFKKVWPKIKFNFIPIGVNSGVSKQPMSDLECIKGARNRANAAMKNSRTDYSVGLEGGLQKIGKEWFDSGWIVVLSKKGEEGVGSSIKMHTPLKMINHIKRGLELGEVDDLLFDEKNSKQKQGHFGLMTKNKIDRSKAYRDAVISALARFINPQIFSSPR